MVAMQLVAEPVAQVYQSDGATSRGSIGATKFSLYAGVADAMAEAVEVGTGQSLWMGRGRERVDKCR